MDSDEMSRKARKRADAERRWQAILRATLTGAYCVILLVAGIYLGIRGREAAKPLPASTLEGQSGGSSSLDGPDGALSGGAEQVGEGSVPAVADSPAAPYISPETDSDILTAEPGAHSEEATSAVITSPASQTPDPTGSLAMPVFGPIVAGPKWVYSDKLDQWQYLPGIEIESQPGAAVVAALSGTVLEVRDDPVLGQVISLSHEDGLVTEYGRLSGCTLVAGDRVKQGEEIARADGTSVYFEAAKGGEALSIDFAR